MRKYFIILLNLIVLVSIAFRSFSQERIIIPEITGEISFDGKVDDPCWNSISPFPLVIHTPVFGNQPTEKSEIMIGYDNTNLYIGARMFDSNPAKMLISSKRRDEFEVASEGLFLILDSFNDKENALGFMTTPSGLRTDFTVFKDAMAFDPHRGPFNLSWNTFWDVRTTRNDQGWFAEVRIPFSSIRFKDDEGKAVMGLICMRWIAYKNEVDIFPAIPPDWGEFSPFRPSKAQEVVFENLKSKKPFYIAPYAIGGLQQDYVLNETSTGYEMDKSPKLTAGLDVKYGLTNNLTMDLTLNTDFAQVEADDEQINLTRFSLFFPEKRTFFQERSSVFTFDFEPNASLFYSRRIGLHEGKQVPIIGGARITGMAGKWDIGFLDMQTSKYQTSDTSISSLTSENFGILRLRRQVINENSYVGGIITSRVGIDGTYNTAYGLDGIFKVFGNDYINVKWAQIFDDSSPNKVFSLDPARVHFNWNRFNEKGLNYDFTFSRSGKYFNPETGFQMRSDYSHYQAGIGYGWIPGEESKLQNYTIGVRTSAYTNNNNGTAQTIESELSYDFMFKPGLNGVFSLGYMYENVPDTFSFSGDAYVPAGKYKFYQFETHINSSQVKRYILGVDFFAGTFYDGTRFSFGLEPSVNIGSTLQLALAYDHNFLKFKSRGQSFSEGIAGFKAHIMFTTKLSVSTFIQYNGADDEMITNLRFRYNPREGNDFYIVFNEGRSTYRDIENPRLPRFNNRALLMKYTYTFTL